MHIDASFVQRTRICAAITSCRKAKGGPTVFENLQTMCRSCNSKKGIEYERASLVPHVSSHGR